MAIEADVPPTWECRCGVRAVRENTAAPIERPGRPVRTHWDMLLERRTVVELQELLTERLDLLRTRSREQRRSA
jgi:hypothetical protein